MVLGIKTLLRRGRLKKKETVVTPSPLSAPPVPPNGDTHRAMWLWGKTNFDSDSEQQDVVDFCGDQGVDMIFADAYGWIGNTNWDLTKLKQFVKLCHDSGIKVFASWGNVDWGTNQAWVQEKIVRRYEAYQSVADHQEQFDGMVLDVEYWTDEGTYPPADNLPGLMDLVKSIQQRGITCGLFAAFWLKDDSATRSDVTYAGKDAQDGEHMMDVADFIVVGAYRDHADDGGAESGPGQNTLFQPWHDYATTEGLCRGLYCGSETTNVSPAYVTYYGGSKSTMETEHTDTSNTYTGSDESVFLGHAVHDYAGWSALS